jgi:DNA modification methylase
MKDIGSVDAVITDPPYGINMDGGTDGFGIRSGRRYVSKWDSQPPTKKTFDIITGMAKVCVIFGGNYFSDRLPVSTHWIVWDKVGEMKFQNPFSDCELIWTNLKKKTTKKYIVIQQGFVAEEKERFHPTQKPVKLMTSIIEDYTNEGDVVLDPYMGSGSTGVACAKLGRKFIGIEIDKDYFGIAEKRIKTAYAQTIMF